jgi:hypothetical protein
MFKQRFSRENIETMSYTRILAFQNILRDSLTLMSNKFPDDADIEDTRNKVELSTSISPHFVIVSFMQNVEPFVEKIKKRDERFFLKIAGEKKSLGSLKLGDKWHKLSEKEKDLLWKNVEKLVQLGNRILSD